MKSRIGILTDNSAQFITEKFLGNQLVHQLCFELVDHSRDINTPNQTFGESIKTRKRQFISLPSEESVRQVFLSLSDQYQEVLVLVISRQINPLYSLLADIINKNSHLARIHLIDSQTIAVGLGLLVQIAASSAQRGFSFEEIKKNIRCIIPKIYSIYCVKNLSSLYFSGLLDPAQAVIGELLGLSPCLVMENGRFIPTHKAKNLHHTTEIFLEFTSEFENLRNITLLYGDGCTPDDFQTFRSRINHQFSSACYNECKINTIVSTILGSNTTGIVLMENL